MWLEHNAFVHAGSLAFYTLFSLAPTVIIAVSVAGLLFGEEAARGEVVAQLQQLVGRDAARAVEVAVSRSRLEVAGLMPTVVGIVTLVIGATTVFAQMQLSLNSIWGVMTRPARSSILTLLRTRLLSLAIVLAIGFVLVVSLVSSVALMAVIRYAENWIALPAAIATGGESVLFFAASTLLFAVIFKVLPDVSVEWEDVWVGAAGTALMFLAGRHLIARYLAYTAPGSAYGAAGSLVLVLLWVYYSSLILLFGAALTKARTVAVRGTVVPTRAAVRVRQEIVEEHGPGEA
ncbi:MAG: YihY/virulence factor BrkB family protein [Acidobacteria bacterium]|nr:YihY/virulence factor BrkB family protein [Acidobacteriota bacterium]